MKGASVKQHLRIREGVIDDLMRRMSFVDDAQMAIVLNVENDDVQQLRDGKPASWDVIMRVAVLAGKQYDASGIVEPIKSKAQETAA